MFLYVVVTLLGVAAVQSQRCSMTYRNDVSSPFYWKGYENICTKSLCDKHTWLKCYEKSMEYIMDQAAGHFPEDILAEIEYLGKYFNTLIPRPNNDAHYSCQGVCQKGMKQLQLERIFADIPVKNKHNGLLETRREMCIVIGPNIYYHQCGGRCDLLYSTSSDSICVADVFVSIDIWVYCPAVEEKSCHKVRLDVPLSCSCRKMRCRKNLPEAVQFLPVLPFEPPNWRNTHSGAPIDPKGLPLGPGVPVGVLIDGQLAGPPLHPGGIVMGPTIPRGQGVPMGGVQMGGVPMVGVPMGGVPMGGIPMGSVPMGGVPMGGVSMGGVPMGGVPMGGLPMGGVPMGGVPMGGVPMGHGLGQTGTEHLINKAVASGIAAGK